jgi:drug/metabolite transporter (DMT)-like permease
MTAGSALRLLILAAIWGGSFLFMRIGAPVLGPAWLIQFRVGIAALFLLICAVWLRKPLQLRQYWRHYLIYFRLIKDMGPISALSVTFLIPVFGILWGVFFLDEQIDWSTIVGAVVVLAGTALTNGITPRSFLESGKRPRPDRTEKSP